MTNTLDNLHDFRSYFGTPHEVVLRKVIDHVDDLAARFLEMCTFVVVGSADADGHLDLSPKGDPPGFVKILSAKEIAIPERPGNRRADTFSNVLANPSVGLLCLVPGMDETLRISGTAHLSIESDLLDSMAAAGKRPNVALVVKVEELFIHCGKAPKRASLWDSDQHIDRSTYPSMGEVMHVHGRLDEIGVSEKRMHDAAQNDYENNVY